MIEFNVIQRECDSAYQDSTRLRKTIIRVCKNYFALIHDLINSSMKISSLINILQTSIVNYEMIKKTFTQHYLQNQDNNDDANHQYFVNRRFHHDDSIHSFRDTINRDNLFNRSRKKFLIDFSKKCFVCEKLNY